MCLGILRRCAHDQSVTESFLWGRQFGGGDRSDNACTALTESVAGPLINYLHDRIEEAGNVLFILERFNPDPPQIPLRSMTPSIAMEW